MRCEDSIENCSYHIIKGRIDAVIFTDQYIYIIEFKMTNASKALQQIKEKNYPQKFLNKNKKIILIGIGFDIENRAISDFEFEAV